ncbi:MAG: PAS domain-containing sensor histidine kinase [Elusimicrobia bacterium]|nr:PAS domain-containing sensor histidine kinase [Elusimicrobiota bacterium]
MNDQPTTVAPRVMDLCRVFLKSFGQTVKLVSLYSAGHPVPASSQQESWQLLHEIFSESGWPEITFALVAGRWLVNGQLAADSAQAYELLAIAFRAHALHSVTFRPECRLYELSALCELASTPPNRAYQTNADDFLKERGVRHISANVEEFMKARRVTLPASALVQKPQPAAPAPRPAAPPAPPRAEPAKPVLGFGSFIKNLVDKAVSDPRERAQIYAEALKHVEQALVRRASESSHKLLLEKQCVVNERVRAESVMTTVAQGKVIVDQEGRILMMDPAAEEIVGHPFAAVAGKKILEGLDGLQSEDKFVVLAKELVIPENRPVSEEILHAGASEAMSAFRQSVAVVHDEQGRVVGTYAVLPHAAKFREAQRMQEEFMANITHDLKAPLTSICSALEVLNDTLRPQLHGEDAEFLDICVRNSGTLRQMIDELLDFSKVSSGRMTVHPEKTPLEPLLRECAQVLLPWARSKRIVLEVEPDPDGKALPHVLADRRRVLQVLNNLVSNAIKFTPEEGRVALSAAPGGTDRPGTVVVTVRDTGCGIAPEDQKRLFERFSQGQSERREGVGLGLAIARELVLQHRGELWMDSEPGRGSTFSFTLPCSPP